jgi:hypothetical protein
MLATKVVRDRRGDAVAGHLRPAVVRSPATIVAKPAAVTELVEDRRRFRARDADACAVASRET